MLSVHIVSASNKSDTCSMSSSSTQGSKNDFNQANTGPSMSVIKNYPKHWRKWIVRGIPFSLFLVFFHLSLTIYLPPSARFVIIIWVDEIS